MYIGKKTVLSLSSFACFSCELPLILKVGRKWTKQAGDICKGTLDMECERDWSVGLRRYVRLRIENKRNIFLISRIFWGKTDSVTLLGFECTINPQNLIKIVWSHFWENGNFKFFLMWTILNFKGRSKRKKQAGNIY